MRNGPHTDPGAPPHRRGWSRIGAGVALVGGAAFGWAALREASGSADPAWAVLGGVLLVTGIAARRGGAETLEAGLGVAAVLLLAWAGLSHAPWGAGRAPTWFGPAGLDAPRAAALTMLLGAWIALQWWGEPDAPRWRRLTPLLVAGLAVARVWPLVARVGIDFFIGDEGTILGGGMGLLAGERLYRDRFEFLWPGSFALTAGLFGIAGPRLVAIHLALTGLLAGCAVLVYSCVARDAGRGWGLVGVLLCLTAFAPQALWWSPHWLSTAAGLLATWLVAREPPPARRRTMLGAGAALGATLLFQQHKGAALALCLAGAYVAFAMWALVQRDRVAAGEIVRGVLWLTVGALAVVGPVLAWFAGRSGIGAFWYATWTWLRDNYQPANTTLPALFPLDPAAPLSALLPSFWAEGSVTVAHVAPLAFPLGVFLWVLPDAAGRTRWRWAVLLAGCGGIFAVTLLRYEYFRLVYVAPATCLLLAAGLGRIVAAPPPRAVWPIVLQGCVLLLVTTMAVHGWRAQFQDLDRRPRLAIADTALGPVTFVSFAKRHLDDTAAALQFLAAQPEDAAVYAYPHAAGYHLLTGRPNPTRYYYLVPGYNAAHQVDEVVRALAERDVRYFLWDRFYTPEWMQLIYPPLPPDNLEVNPLIDYVRAHYRVVLHRPTLLIYERADGRAAGPGP